MFQAAVFCLGIIVLFSAHRTADHHAARAVRRRAARVESMGERIHRAACFLVFGLSLLGAFEITLPSGMLTKLDGASQRGGILGTLLMGLTFCLTSFACVGPFVGPLLAASAQAGGARPLIGHGGLRDRACRRPFFLLAVFPGFLKRLPRSGGWLPRVKVVMGFVVLAAMLKYVASVDQVLQWNVLTRERFLAAWVVLFAMAGLYLLGFLRLEGVSKDEPLGLGRLLTGAVFLVFAISLIPGMFGRSWATWTPTFRWRPNRRERARAACSELDEERLSRRARAGSQRGQAGAGQLHRVRLHQLSLDESQHVHASGNRRRHETVRAAGALHRRLGFRGGRESEGT